MTLQATHETIDHMRPKRGETAEQTINRWATELLMSTLGKTPTGASPYEYDRALEMVEWLRNRLLVLRAHNT